MNVVALPVDSLERAYGDNRALLIRFLAGKLDNHHSAEDLVQEIFLALPHVRRDPPIRNPKSFLFRMAANLAINLNTQEARRAALRTEHADILWTAVEEITPERHLLGDEALVANQSRHRGTSRAHPRDSGLATARQCSQCRDRETPRHFHDSS